MSTACLEIAAQGHSRSMHHANAYWLMSVDGIQSAFLDVLSLTEGTALLEFNLGLLATCWDVAMLGLIHKNALCLAPTSLTALFPANRRGRFPRSLRAPNFRHSRQLGDAIDGSGHQMLDRFAFGLVYAYNLVPERVVECSSVASFQRMLQRALMYFCRSGNVSWSKLFRNGIKAMSVPRVHSHFI